MAQNKNGYTGANLGFEEKMWQAADKLRNNMDAAEYKHDHILTPGRYVGFAEKKEDDEPFEEKMERLTSQLSEQFEWLKELETNIKSNLKLLGV